MDPNASPAGALLALLSCALLSGLCATLVLRGLAAARVGTPLYRGRNDRRPRLLALLVLAVLAVLTLAVPGAPSAVALLVLGLSAALVIFTPARGDTLIGVDGVQSGWHAARLGDLEEWRLTGEHLRWRQRGEWLASQAPPEHHAALRATLETLARDRESRFQH